MTQSAPNRVPRLAWGGALAAGLAVLIWFVPLFHVLPLEETRQQAQAGAFNAETFVDEFWAGPLATALEDAVDAGTLLDELGRDFAAAGERYGHRLGLSSRTAFLVSGEGTVVDAGEYRLGISLDDDDTPEVIIEVGPVFGNAIRDGSGQLDVSRFANAQEFNAISEAINRRVEAGAMAQLEAGVAPGQRIRFTGGTEVADSGQAPGELLVVPVNIELP
ncbi:DUF2291 domain-containing protein [Marinihelvus fidelis]|uniref:DUF2291 domain-containing protein n=1 Tax=Marinihelvus fidelis TaxID=2613842 RepID=A0A5N0T800_9GAMM|nr:DUF2291 family protein [Marinihelvus fidelis]KAA9131042.1 DUF2291 domain-containing protein [Marinihelvus fidelis]